MPWIDEVQTGDWVMIEDYVHRGCLRKVAASSPYSITTEDGVRYCRTTGKELGIMEFPRYLVQPTIVRVREMRRFKLAARLGAYRWAYAPLAVLDGVARVLDDKPDRNDPDGPLLETS